MSVQTYSTAGTFSWTVPTGVTSVAISVAGSGGGGGGCGDYNNYEWGNGGGSGLASSITVGGVVVASAPGGGGGDGGDGNDGTPGGNGTNGAVGASVSTGLTLNSSGGAVGGFGNNDDGNNDDGGNGGNGALVTGTLPAVPGAVWTIVVGALGVGGTTGGDPFYTGLPGAVGHVTLTYTSGGSTTSVTFRHYEIW